MSQRVRDADREKVAISRTAAALLSAVNASDVGGVLAVWSDDGVLMPPHHPSVSGHDAIERYFTRLFDRSRFMFSFTNSCIVVAGDLAIERVEYTARMLAHAGGAERHDAGKGVHIFRRQADGGWKLVMDIWNSDM